MPLPDATRRYVYARARYRCEYCQLRDYLLHPDHIVPRSQWPGGPGYDEPENLAAACLYCNSTKRDHATGYDPLTGTEQPLFNPRSQRWADHLGWTSDYTETVGLTAIGRATVRRLRLNRSFHRRHRRLLRAAAEAGFDPWP